MVDSVRIFQEQLKDLLAIAKGQGMRLSEDEIRAFLKSAGLNDKEEYFSLVRDYLEQAGIRTGLSSASENGFQPDAEPLSDESGAIWDEGGSLSLYLKELDSLTGFGEDEELSLFHMAVKKDRLSRERIIERYLSYVCSLAGEFEASMADDADMLPGAKASSSKGGAALLEAEDLLQEANMALIMAVDELEKEESLAAYRARLLNLVWAKLRESLSREEEKREGDMNLISRLNQLYKASGEFEEMEGRKPSALELSSYMQLPLEKIEDLIRIAGE